MQEYRVSIAFLPGLTLHCSADLDKFHTLIEGTGTRVLNCSLIGIDRETEKLSVTLWLDATAPHRAHSAASDIVCLALRTFMPNIDPIMFQSVTVEVSDVSDAVWFKRPALTKLRHRIRSAAHNPIRGVSA